MRTMTIPAEYSTRTLTRRLPEEAFAWVDRHARALPTESISSNRAAGRVLAEAVEAPADIPGQPLAATDGYAVRAEDTQGAGDYSPLPLRLAAGGAPVAAGEAVAVSDGDPLPAGADAVLPLEHGEILGAALEISSGVARGQGVVRPGDEAYAGALLLPAGHHLRPQDLAHLAMAGVATIKVHRQPSVRVVLAGRFGHDTDGAMLGALVARDGGVLDRIETAADPTALAASLTPGGSEVILLVGGTGLGRDDHAAAALARAGELAFHGLALYPGDSAGLGRVGETLVVLLPGSPLPCLCAYDLVAARALRRLGRLPGPWPYPARSAVLTRKIASDLGRLELCRVRLVEGGVEPVAVAEGRLLATAVRADGFVVVPVHSEGYAAGTTATVYLYDPVDQRGAPNG